MTVVKNIKSPASVGALLAVWLLGSPCFAQSNDAIPAVQRVVENGSLPWSSAKLTSGDFSDLGRYGYVEEEFFVSGTANVRELENGGAVIAPNEPYTTRILVRRPSNPQAFSGNVILEPFHFLFEKEENWRQLRDYMLRKGDVWVGVTVEPTSEVHSPQLSYWPGGIELLKSYDPVRYAPLHLYPQKLLPDGNLPAGYKPPPGYTQPPVQSNPLLDYPVHPPQGHDIVAQVGRLLKANGPTSPLKVLNARQIKLIAVGAGIPGYLLVTFINQGRHDEARLPDGKPVFDAYLVGGSSRKPPKPPQDALFAQVWLEYELYRFTRAEKSGHKGVLDDYRGHVDLPNYRIYEIPGVGHLGSYNRSEASNAFTQFNHVAPTAEWPYKLEPVICENINDEPFGLVSSALLYRAEEWLHHGTPMPVAQKLATDEHTQLVRDPVTRNLVGGVRLPWIAAPVAAYNDRDGLNVPPMMASDTSAGMAPTATAPVNGWPRAGKELAPGARFFAEDCYYFNPRQPYDSATLKKLYRSYDDYVLKFEKAKSEAVKAGFLLKEDAATLRPRGKPEDFR